MPSPKEVKDLIESAGGEVEEVGNRELDNRFSYHAPKEGQPEQYAALRSAAKDLAAMIVDSVPASREQSLALTNLEQAIFWANAGIARRG